MHTSMQCIGANLNLKSQFHGNTERYDVGGTSQWHEIQARIGGSADVLLEPGYLGFEHLIT